MLIYSRTRNIFFNGNYFVFTGNIDRIFEKLIIPFGWKKQRREKTGGESLGVAYSDEVSGELTINPGKLSYSRQSGGGTYARSLKSGVAFGPLFPGRPDIAHQKDEFIEINDLLKATAIYAQAIYELAK